MVRTGWPVATSQTVIPFGPKAQATNRPSGEKRQDTGLFWPSAPYAQTIRPAGSRITGCDPSRPCAAKIRSLVGENTGCTAVLTLIMNVGSGLPAPTPQRLARILSPKRFSMNRNLPSAEKVNATGLARQGPEGDATQRSRFLTTRRLTSAGCVRYVLDPSLKIALPAR